MTVINVTLYSTICLMHRSEELSFPLWYEAAVVVTTICYIRFPSIKMPSGTVKTAGEYDIEFVYLSPSSILHPPHTHTFVCVWVCMTLCEVRLDTLKLDQIKSKSKFKFVTKKEATPDFSNFRICVTFSGVFCFTDQTSEKCIMVL